MDPGTVLAIVDLVAKTVQTVSKVIFEFTRKSRDVPEKLLALSMRLETLNSFLQTIIQQTGSPDKLSATGYPGIVSVGKTLVECQAFLESYQTVVSSTGSSLSAAAQRIRLLVGSDKDAIQEFNDRLDRHYQELSFGRLLQLGIPPVTVSSCPPCVEVEDRGFPQPDPHNRRASGPETSPYDHSAPGPCPKPPPAPVPPRPHFDSLESSPYSGGTAPPTKSEPRPTSSICSEFSQAGTVALKLETEGQVHETWEFLCTSSEVSDAHGRRTICWSLPLRDFQVRHYLPITASGRIPYTKPNDPKRQVSFCPFEERHSFDIISGDISGASIRSIEAQPKYSFSRKADRDAFQRNVRPRQHLETVEALKIHTLEGEIALIVHLKIWRRDEFDAEPTISFAQHRKHDVRRHVEYTIRWFERAPELRKANRVVLRLRTPVSDGRRRSSTSTKRFSISGHGRRTSGSVPSSLTSPVLPSGSSGSTSSGSSGVPPGPTEQLLYTSASLEAPPEIRSQGYLDIEFKNSKGTLCTCLLTCLPHPPGSGPFLCPPCFIANRLPPSLHTVRSDFISACFRAHSHHPHHYYPPSSSSSIGALSSYSPASLWATSSSSSAGAMTGSSLGPRRPPSELSGSIPNALELPAAALDAAGTTAAAARNAQSAVQFQNLSWTD
ncbi:hypothetical protein GGR56DRAFT_551578 [Xylariaceae sp. FL0804]|nr:hypothetical protein GGR56DRAFT_551578 [Xylariaceae sp. FL0804]